MNDKLDKLRTILSGMDTALIAFSGGVDSTFLLKVAHEVLGNRLTAVTAESPVHPASELMDAKRLATQMGVKYRIIRTREMAKEDFLENPPHRCYICKKTIFSALLQIAITENIDYVIDGSNADDLDDYRPGLQALEELKVRSPLQEAGLKKEEIRQLSQRMNLPTWNKPALACLASRIPYGSRITKEKLIRIDKAESWLREQGFPNVRVRDHEGLARIEVAPGRMALLLKTASLQPVVETIKSFGFTYVSMDLQGYRTGSLNEGIQT